MSTDKNSLSFQWIDLLRVISMMAVVMIHLCSPILNMTWGKQVEEWWVGNVVFSAIRFAVPVFVMISGATLLTKEIQWKTFYKKRMQRVVYPLLFWVPAYFLFRFFMLKVEERPNIQDVFLWMKNLFLEEGVSKHLWFMYMIVLLYALIPFIKIWIDKLSGRGIVLLLVCWSIVNAMQHFGLSLPQQWPWIYQKLYVYLNYGGYLILGYCLVKYGFLCRWNRIKLFVFYLLTVVLVSGLTYVLSLYSGKSNLIAQNVFNVLGITQSILVFRWIQKKSLVTGFFSVVIHTLCTYSLGIYLVHIMVISIFYRFGLFWNMAHPLFSLPLLFLLTVAISFLLVFLLRKIPYVGKYIV